MAADKQSHLLKRGVRNRRKLVSLPLLALLARLSLLRPLDPGIRWCPPLLAQGSRPLAHEDVTKGGDRGHEERDTALQNLPQDLPYCVDTSGIGNSRGTDDRDDNHDDGEAEEEAHG